LVVLTKTIDTQVRTHSAAAVQEKEKFIHSTRAIY